MSCPIVEEDKVELPQEEKTSSKSESSSKGFNKDKLKAKLQLRKSKPTSNNDEPPVNTTTSASLSVDQQPLLKSKLSFEKKEKKELLPKLDIKKKQKERSSVVDKNDTELIPLMPTTAAGAATVTLSTDVNGENSTSAPPPQAPSQPEFDSVEKVEELIQKKLLPKETVAIHSPESGTTIF